MPVSMQPFTDLSPTANAWIIVTCGTPASALGLYLLRSVLIRRMRALSARTCYTFDTLLAHTLTPVLSILAVVATIAVLEHLLRFVEILPAGSTGLSKALIQVLSIIAILLVIDKPIRAINTAQAGLFHLAVFVGVRHLCRPTECQKLPEGRTPTGISLHPKPDERALPERC